MALERQLNIELKVKQGAENMIPIYANGAAKVTHACTDTSYTPSMPTENTHTLTILCPNQGNGQTSSHSNTLYGQRFVHL